MCTYRIVGIAREIATTKCMDPLFTEEHDFQIDPRDIRCTEEKRGKSGTLWKEKNRERVNEGMRMRMADCRERKRKRKEGERERKEETEGKRERKVDVWKRKRERERDIYRQRWREKGETWSSKRQSSIPRRRAPVYPAICI